MSFSRLSEGISFRNMIVNSVSSGSGIFAGKNAQYAWTSRRRTQAGFGTVQGIENTLENPCSAVTDPGSSDELLDHIRKNIEKRFGG